jgi:4-amino-4-deoxy-L-arabinose transferase-like glycosyltransferase
MFWKKECNWQNIFLRNFDLVAVFILITYSLIVWWPTRLLPYHWDSAGYIINAAKDFTAKNFSTLIPDVGLEFAHPPLFTIGLAIIWKVFGESILVSHLTEFIFLPILLISTYFIGKRFLSSGISLLAAILVGLTPVVVAEYGLIYIDLPVAALVTLGLCLWMREKYLLAGLVVSMATMIKIPAILILGIFGLDIFKEKKVKLKQSWKFYLGLFLPLVFLTGWLVYHYNARGWLLIHPNRLGQKAKYDSGLFSNLVFVGNVFFISQGKWILAMSGFIATFYLYLKDGIKKAFNFPVIQLVSVFVLGTVFYAYMGEFGLRYGIFMLPAFVLSVLYFINSAFGKHSNLTWLCGIIFSLFLLFNWHPKIPPTSKYEYRPSEDLSYQDIIKIGREAAAYIQANYPSAVVYGSFPEGYQVTQPYQGYVSKTFEFYECKDFKFDPDKTQVVYVHPYSPFQMYCRLLLEQIPVRPLKHIESNGKWLELYKVEASVSAIRK